MTITFNWFSFLLDSAILMYSVSSFRRHYPEAELKIWEDYTAPINDPARDYCQELGATIAKTNWPRGGNLNGMASMNGVLDCLATATTDYTCKVDSDTLLRKRGRLEGYFANDVVFLTWQKRAFGFFYGMRPAVIEKIKARPWSELMEFSPRFPEDMMIYRMAKNAGLGVAEVPFESRIWIGWKIGEGFEDLADVDIVTVGQRPANLSRTDARALAVAAAEQLEPLL
ncbi:MAG: hypothetical protein LBV12_07015 [Puniceicoccales bacterium]|jgi:hypothetical protein|nr:hypothetical protein [Puniceicoccales bacterium]